MYFHSI